MQRKAEGQGGAGAVPAAGGAPIRAAVSGGEPLSADLRGFFEPRFGRDLGEVRVHSGPAASAAARAVNARAFTLGRDVVFGSGEYAPGTTSGRWLIAHELAHTIQQRSSLPSLQGKLRLSEADDPAERAADQAADAMARGAGAPALDPVARGVVQRQKARSCTRGAVREDVATVTCTDGAEYEVHPVIVKGIVPSTQTDVAGGLSQGTLFLQVKVCRGRNDVEITASMDVARPVQQLIQKVLSGAPGVAGVRLDPQVSFVWVRSRDFEVEVFGGPTVVGGAPRVGGSGGVRVQHGQKVLEVDVGSDPTLTGPGGGPEIHGTVKGGVATDPVRKVDCTTERKTVDYQCTPITHTPAEKEIPPDDVQAYVFFEYAKDKVVPPTPRLLRGNGDLTGTLAELAADGYRVQSIDAHTSPEGRRGAPRRGEGFPGNDRLSEMRAAGALAWIRGDCPQCLGGKVESTAESELYSGFKRPGVELEGDPLTKRARRGFLGQDVEPADPLRRPEHDVLERLSPAKQREELYPLLRRAVIHLHREGKPGKAAKPQPGTPGPCPDDVLAAMRRR